MRLKWSSEAQRDYYDQIGYIAERNFPAARKIQNRVSKSIELLRLHPEIGRPGRVEGTRELIVSGAPLIVIYSFADNCIVIIGILNTYMDYP